MKGGRRLCGAYACGRVARRGPSIAPAAEFHCHTICSEPRSSASRDLADQAIEAGAGHLRHTIHHSSQALARCGVTWIGASGWRDRPSFGAASRSAACLEGCPGACAGLFTLAHAALAPLPGWPRGGWRGLQGGGLSKRSTLGPVWLLLAHPARYRALNQQLIRAAASLGFDGASTFTTTSSLPAWAASPLGLRSDRRQLATSGLLPNRLRTVPMVEGSTAARLGSIFLNSLFT